MKEELKPCPCETGKAILAREVISDAMLQWMGDNIGQREINAASYTLGVIIDVRNGHGHLRLVDVDDCNCLDAGKFIEIEFCPICGKRFGNTRHEESVCPECGGEKKILDIFIGGHVTCPTCKGTGRGGR